jgi:diguanylate cyclase (GGDEF)-like protein/PAS domain S-box-containing protein
MIKHQTRILVVDDAPLMRNLLEQVLQKYGYLVTTARDGQQAIEDFINYQPDLILMDADMPVLDGVSACARIRKLPAAKHIPIIMVTAFTERQWIDRAYAAGATDYITKPVNLDVLRNRIYYILRAKETEEALFDEKEKAQVTLASICDGVITTDANGQVEFLNPVATKLTGWTTEEAQGLPLNQVFSIVDGNTQQPLIFPIQRCIEGQTISVSNKTVLIHRHSGKQFAVQDSAAPIRARNGSIIGVVLVFHDVTATRQMTQELSYRAKHDALTGLWNLHEFKAQLQRLFNTPPITNTEHFLLYMDLDQFKIVNDTCGHEAGDQLLKDVALLLQKKLEMHISCTQIVLARLGGDEFGVLLENCSLEKALKISQLLVETIKKFRFFWKTTNINSDKKVFSIGISIGLVPIVHKTVNQKSILAMADAACYAAKNAGRNGVHIYQPDDMQPVDENIQWVSLIHNNLGKNDGFFLYHQPIIPLIPDSSLYSYEIFLRMPDEQGNLIPPGAFLSVAARYNLISTLDLWVIRHFLAWMQHHLDDLKKVSFCSLNLSGHSLNEPHFVPEVIKLITAAQLPPHKLCFDISETAAITNFTGVLALITALKPLGCLFALDNFGAGMASFTYLRDLPVDFLKIDGPLIKNMMTDQVDFVTVKSINEIAHLMQLKTIAQTVENSYIFERLKEIKVDYVQGYWISKPKPLDSMFEFSKSYLACEA